MKIGTLLTAAIVSLSAVGGGLAVYVAVTKYQTMDKVSVAQNRLEVVRAVGDIPRYMNPERGFSTNILFGPAVVDPKMRTELNDKYRKETDGALAKINQVRKAASGSLDDGAAVGSADRCAEHEIRSAARRHRQGHRRSGRSPQGCRQEDRRRQRRLQHRRYRAARRAGPQDRAARRRRLPAGELRQHRLDPARRRRLQFQPAQEPRRRQARRNRRRKDGFEPVAGPQRPDPDVAAGPARQSLNARQRRRQRWTKMNETFVDAFRQGNEARQGRRDVRQI